MRFCGWFHGGPAPVPDVSIFALVLAACLATGPAPAAAQVNPVVTVKLTVLQIDDDGDDDDSLSDADFYVAGAFTPTGSPAIPFNNEGQRIEGEQTIHPNWAFEFAAPSSAGSGKLAFQVLDYDSGLNFGDDRTVDATFDVDFASCGVREPGLGISATCGWDVTVDQDDTAVIRVEVLFPPSSPGLLVRCLQDPLVPNAGQPVTIQMETLDGTGAQKIATEQVIEINNTAMSRATAVATSSYTFTPGDPQFFMRCWAKNTIGGNPDAEVADTWRRQVRVGALPERAIPVAIVGPSARAVDIVAVPDADVLTIPTNTRTGAATLADEPGLQAALRTAIWNGFFATPYVLSNQNRFNFWLARTVGDTDGMPGTCGALTAPEDWDQYSYADSGWIVHDDNHRDCANGSLRLYGGWTGNPQTPVHETGHTPFGLADEYCCDGGYYQVESLPNLYTDLQACTADLLNAGAQPGDCRPVGTGTWYTSDPMPDVMTDDQRTFNRLDRRRANWFLDRCANSAEGC